MQRLLIASLVLTVLTLAGCGSDSKETAQTTDQADTATVVKRAYNDPTPANTLDDGSVFNLKSGVRCIDLIEGQGHSFEEWDYIKYDYAVWFTDTSGNYKRRLFYDSYRSQQPYYGQIGDRMIGGLVIGLQGMKEGGSRRIFIPDSLAYKPSSPVGSGPMIFEVYDAQVSSALDVDEFRSSYNNKDELKERAKKVDYLQERRADSLERVAKEHPEADTSGQGN